jgi:hypothetical protein
MSGLAAGLLVFCFLHLFKQKSMEKVMLENEPVNSSGHVDLAKKKSCGGRPKHVHNITIH